MSTHSKLTFRNKIPQDNTTAKTMHLQQQSRLLQLPTELQLAIFEFAVIEDEPLLVNCGCDSSYSSIDDWNEDQGRWDSGEKHPPAQPGLTRTCRAVRVIALPMFYKQNSFRAHYCYEADFAMAVSWLKDIGQANRELMADFAMLDMNWMFDLRVPSDIKKVRRSEIVREMGGRMETMEKRDCCFHRVMFGLDDDEYYELVPMLFEGNSES